MPRFARAAFAVTLSCAAAALAGDPPKKPKAVPRMPREFVQAARCVRDLAAGESSLAVPNAIWIAADGSGWAIPSGELLTERDVKDVVPPTIRRNADNTVDVDLTNCTMLWSPRGPLGEPFVPRASDLRVKQFVDGSAAPTPLLTGRCRGERVWALPPGMVAYVPPYDVGVNERGQAWVRAWGVARLTPFTDTTGPAVAVTASDRDAVKIDLTGVTYRWEISGFPKVAPIKEDESLLNGHKVSPFAVTSFTVDGRVSVKFPKEFMAPQVRDLKVGEAGYVDTYFVRIDPNGGAWIDPDAAVAARPSRDDWGYSKVRVMPVDGQTWALDLCGSTYRWCVALLDGRKFPAVLDEGNVAFGQKWFKVGRVQDGEQVLGAVLPERCRAVRIFEIEPGGVVYTSCSYLDADRELAGYVRAWAPVCISPFEDDLGPAVAVHVDEEDTCAVDLRGATYKWQPVPDLEVRKVAKPEPGGPRVSHVKVIEFLVPDVPDPPKPPPKKPPPKKK